MLGSQIDHLFCATLTAQRHQCAQCLSYCKEWTLQKLCRIQPVLVSTSSVFAGLTKKFSGFAIFGVPFVMIIQQRGRSDRVSVKPECYLSYDDILRFTHASLDLLHRSCWWRRRQ